MIDNTIVTALAGITILAVSLYRGSKIARYNRTIGSLLQSAREAGIDSSEETSYPESFSHQWLMQSAIVDRPGKIKTWFRNLVDGNTIVIFSLFAFLMFSSAMLITSILVSSVILTGIRTGILLSALIVIIGTNDPKMSAGLLKSIEDSDSKEISGKDYPYALIAKKTVFRSVMITTALGILFITVSPWINIIIQGIAYGVAWFTYAAILYPATLMAQFNMGLAMFYIASVLPFIIYAILKITQVVYLNQHQLGLFLLENLDSS